MAKESSQRTAGGVRSMRLLRRGTKSASVDYYDYNLLAAVVLLTCFGLVMLYSVSAYEASVDYSNDMFYFAKQALIGAAAFIIMLVGSRIDYHRYVQFAPLLYVGSLALLFITKFIGREVNGAKRWIYIGNVISFQPAEIAKLAVILFLPALIVKAGRRFRKFRVPFITACFGFVAAGMTYVFTDNLSTGIIIFGITLALIIIAHPKPQKLLLALAIILIVIIIAAIVMKLTISADSTSSSFRIRRILTWLHPEENEDEGGYQIMQALYAIGSGGLFGKGLGNSTQKLGALPEAQNDMIFSIICEELGIIGAMIVMLLFVFLLWRLFIIATNAPDLLGSLIAAGIFAHIALQVILNIAVVTNVIPTTGITLPFVSYGGTSILFLMLEMMLALSISGQIKEKG